MTSLKRFSPAFIKVIDESSRKVFGNLPIVPYRTGFKLLRTKPIGPLLNSYFPHDFTKNFRSVLDNFQTDLEQRRANALLRAKRQGKGPPKKGEGRRASKKK